MPDRVPRLPGLRRAHLRLVGSPVQACPDDPPPSPPAPSAAAPVATIEGLEPSAPALREAA